MHLQRTSHDEQHYRNRLSAFCDDGGLCDANPEAPLEATAAAVCAMGICGEKAYARLTEQDGNSSYRNYIIDAICKLTGEELESCAKYEIL